MSISKPNFDEYVSSRPFRLDTIRGLTITAISDLPVEYKDIKADQYVLYGENGGGVGTILTLVK